MLKAPIEQGHISSALCHTANISYRLGKTLPPEQTRYLLQKNSDTADAYGRMRAHLEANKVELSETRAELGPDLKMDPRTQRFTNSHKANTMLTRNYRKPFVVTEQA